MSLLGNERKKPVVAQHLFPGCETFNITFSDKSLGKHKLQRCVAQERGELKKDPNGQLNGIT